MKTDAEFWNAVAPKYAQQSISDEAAYELTLARTMSYLNGTERAVELGCGTGATALRLAEHVKAYHGTDISPKMIEIARARAEEASAQNVSFDVAQADAKIGKADVILGHNVFHLVSDSARIFRRVHDALPKGGLFISKTPCLKDLGMFKRLAFGALVPLLRLFGKAPKHVTLFHSPELEREIEAAGFEIIEALSAPRMSRYIVARKA